MRKADKIRLTSYILALGIALVYPIGKIISFEYPSVPPTTYLFETEIFDPYDPMRGRYVQLNFKQNEVRLPHKNTRPAELSFGSVCYAVLETNPDGTARIVDLLPEQRQIPDGKDFLKVKYRHFRQDYDQEHRRHENTGIHVIELPFNRFYLNERLAPMAEEQLQRHTRRGSALARVKVYHNGNFALVDLIVDGKPLLERLREM